MRTHPGGDVVRSFATLARHKRALSVVAMAVLIAVPVAVAILHPGFPAKDVDLTAQSVWVTNGKQLLGGRLNHQIGELDAAVSGSSSSLDVLQDGSAYFLTDTSQGTVDRIDPAFVSLVDRIQVPVDSQLAYGANTLAILSPAGSLWVLPAEGRLDFAAAKTPPAARLGKDARVVVTKAGATFAVSPTKKKMYSVVAPGSRVQSAPFPALASYQITAVGDDPVVLDQKTDDLITRDGSRLALPGKGMRLQQPGAADPAVLVATTASLVSVPLDGSRPTTIAAEIDELNPVTRAGIAAPVRLNGCSYGAWADAGRYLYACDGVKAARVDIPQPTAGDALEFRVNHGVIALNNLANGNAWMVTSTMQIVRNWAELKPDETQKDGQEGEEKPVQQSIADTLATRSSSNRPPIAVNDDLGVRPGRTTILPILANDTDPDGDVLTIANTTAVPDDQGTLQTIDGGRSVQFTPTPTSNGTISFRYTADDGRGGTATAQVNASIRPLTENLAPASTRDSAADVEVGQSIHYNVLTDWLDPDGDDSYLVGAAATTGDDVQFAPDGTVTFTSKTGQTGSKEVRFTVSDGRASATGSLIVTVRPQGELDPVAIPDAATGFVAAPVSVTPLSNDRAPSGNPLSLVSVRLDEPTAGSITTDLDRGTVTFQTARAGVYYARYTIASGAKSSDGLMRFDIAEGATGDPAPIAVKDVAYLRPGEPTTVTVLDNDVSPSGRVLAVQSVDVSAAEGDPVGGRLSVEVLSNTAIRVSSSTALTTQLQFQYTVSDGNKTSTAGVTVVPVPPLTKHQPPDAADDQITVRAGDIATVPVLDNDVSPDAVPLTLDPTLVDVSSAGGLAFVDGRTVRYQAPAEPGTFSIVYRVVDGAGESAVANVGITVLAAGPKGNHAPKPLPQTARVFAGSSSKITVQLNGIDPDGDSVDLAGVLSPPTFGRILRSDGGSLTYEAYPGSAGTDEFSYQVVDSYGATASATIRVGVIPPPTNALPPNAVDDKILVKPRRTVAAPLLANDSDPSGNAISLMPGLREVETGITAKVAGDHVEVTAGAAEGTFSLRYEITNGHGGTDTAFVQVVVSKNAVILPPTAIDQKISGADVRGKTTVTVNPRAGAENPGGRVTDLAVSLVGTLTDRAEVTERGIIRVHPSSQRQTIAYRLTNEIEKLSATAFIIVPPRDGSAADAVQPPYLKKLPPQLVEMNGTKSWKLADLVVVPSGKPPTIESAQASNSDGVPVKKSGQSLTFTPAKDYRGPAAVTFLVTDAAGPGDASATKALLTIPITVGNADFTDAPPTFTPPKITIEADGEVSHLNLRDSSAHPNPDVVQQLSFEGFTDPSAEVAGSLNGSDLSISAPFGVKPGTMAVLSFTVRYKQFAVPGSVAVTVVSSTKPLAQTVTDTKEVRRGKSATADVVANDTNPFQAKGKPLTLLDAKIETVGTTASVSFSPAGKVTVVAGQLFVGDVSVVYTVGDATEDPARRVQGRYVVTVSDVPDKPSAPKIASEGDGTIGVAIAAPEQNGKPITRYTVSGAGQTKTSCTPGVTCVFSGLDNGTSYTFDVFATNSNGDSETSAPSAPAIPYGKPGKPASASLSATNNGNGAVSQSWTPPTSDGGRAISNYNWRFVAGTAETGSQAGTSRTFTGGIGVTYQYEVQACSQGGCGGWTQSNQAQPTAPPPWAPTHYAGQITKSICPEPESSYPTGAVNASHGCTDNPAGVLQPGTVIDAICSSDRGNQGANFMFNTGNGYSGSEWYVRIDHTNIPRGAVPNC